MRIPCSWDGFARPSSYRPSVAPSPNRQGPDLPTPHCRLNETATVHRSARCPCPVHQSPACAPQPGCSARPPVHQAPKKEQLPKLQQEAGLGNAAYRKACRKHTLAPPNSSSQIRELAFRAPKICPASALYSIPPVRSLPSPLPLRTPVPCSLLPIPAFLLS